MSKEADINWLKSCIENRESKLKILNEELLILQTAIPILEHKLETDREELKELESE